MEIMFTNLKTVYDNTPALNGPLNGLFPYKAPDGTPYPFLTWSFPDSTIEYVMDAPRGTAALLEFNVIQFSIWDNDSSPIRAIQISDILKATFDDYFFPWDGSVNMIFSRIFDNLLDDEEKGWQYVVQYEIKALK